MNHNHARNRVDELFSGGLPAPRHVRLRDHLRECDGCRRYYEGVRAAEDAMFAEPTALNDSALSRMADLAVERPRTRVRKGSWWVALFAASATAAVALLFTVQQGTVEEQFTPRGAAEVAVAGMTVFHIDRVAERVTRLARAPGGVAIPSGAVIQLGITTTDELTHLAVLGVDGTDQVHWYQEPTTVPAGVVDEVVGGAWKLTNPGWLRLFAVFSNQPLDGTALEAAAIRLRGADLSTVGALPGITPHQDSILLEVGR